MALNQIDIHRLLAGDKRAWDEFVAAAAPLIHAVARRVLQAHGRADADDVLDTAQDVFVRLAANDYRLLAGFDPARASLRTWLAVVARSASVDFLRRRRQPTVPLDQVPEPEVPVFAPPEHLEVPPGLLTERQALVLRLLYDRDLDVAEAAALLRVDAQTVRSTHHKAVQRLRQHFGVPAAGGR